MERSRSGVESEPANERAGIDRCFVAVLEKSLGHPVRIRLLEVLRHGERSVQELQGALALDQSTVSQQLAVLRPKHVVVARKEGTTVRYAVRDGRVGALLDTARACFGQASSLYCQIHKTLHATVQGENVATLLLRLPSWTTNEKLSLPA